MIKPLLALCTALVLVSCTSAPGVQEALPSTTKVATQKGFDADLSQFAYPWPVNFYSIDTQGQKLRMAYMDIGAQANIPKQKTIVLLHGKNFGGFYFERLAKDLVAQGYRVVIPDQIGFGKSSKPRNFQYSFAALARHSGDLLKELGVDTFTLLGHSMGGMLATRMTLTYPNQVQKLVLVNPIGLEDYRVLTGYKTIDELYASEQKATRETIQKYQRESYYDGKWKPAYDALIEPAVGWTEGPDKDLLAYTAALTSDMVYNQPVSYEFNAIEAKTVIFIGQRDRTAIGKAWASPANQKRMGDYPKLGKSLARAIPKSRLIELEGLGHVPFIEDYDRFAKVFFENI